MRFSGEQMYQRRLRRNMSRADLAMAIRKVSHGETKATERGVRGWEKGEYTPHSASVPAIADALGCAIVDLYGSNGHSSDDDGESRTPVAAMSLDEFLRLRIERLLTERAEMQAGAR